MQDQPQDHRGAYLSRLAGFGLAAVAAGGLTLGLLLQTLETRLRQAELQAVSGTLAGFALAAKAEVGKGELAAMAGALSDSRHAVRLTLVNAVAASEWQEKGRISSACLPWKSTDVCLKSEVIWTPGLAMLGRDALTLLLAALASLVLATVLALHLFLYRRFIVPLAATTEDLAKYRARAQTLDMVLHDLRKPFRALKLTLDSAAEASSPASAQASLRTALPRLQTMIADVDEMLRTARAQVTKSTSDKASLHSVESLIDTALAQCASLLAESGVVFVYRFRHLRKIRVDQALVIRMLVNLVANAAEAMQHKGEIWFVSDELSIAGRPMLRLAVGNSGSYIKPADKSRLFDAFFTKDKQGGTGLGLALVKLAAELHGGTVTVRSEPDVGTEFHVTLPLDATALSGYAGTLPAAARDLAARGGPDTPRTKAADTKGPRIILVEDDPFIQEEWSRDCTDAELEIWSRPEDLLAAIAADAQHLATVAAIVTDFHFDVTSSLDGGALAARLREVWPGPIILSSGSIFGGDTVQSSIDLTVEKRAHTWSELQELLGRGARSAS